MSRLPIEAVEVMGLGRLVRSALCISVALLCLFALPEFAGANSGYFLGNHDGRMPGQPDFKRVGNATQRFLPGQGEYEVRRPNTPPAFFHVDSAEGMVAASEEEEEPEAYIGPGVELPTQELAPICRNANNRIVVFYTHGPSETAPAPTAEIRQIVRRMNWKFADQSSQSSGGARSLRMAVECDVGGEILVHEATYSGTNFLDMEAAVRKVVTAGEGINAIKYLVFDNRSSGEILGQGAIFKDARKGTEGSENANATLSNAAVIWSPANWRKHVSIHELLHTLGATQFNANPPPPFATLFDAHCTDGQDALCYASYGESDCPASQGYGTPVGVPIDCHNDTYFDATQPPPPGSWLKYYWNVGGVENPFLSVPATAPPWVETSSASVEGAKNVLLHGSAIETHSEYTTYWFEWGATTAYGNKTPNPERRMFGSGDTVYRAITTSPESTYHYRIAVKNDAGTSYGADKTFTTTPPPTLQANDYASNLSPTGATLTGKVDANGLSTTYRFEYGTTKGYGTSIPVPSKSIGSKETSVDVSVVLTGLEPKTTYYWRLAATNNGGTAYRTNENDDSFTTPAAPPTATTEPANSVENTSATLAGKINPQGTATTFYFEYGKTTAYGDKIPTSAESIGSGTTALYKYRTIKGLSANATYHYRVVATNEGGTTVGADESFTTTQLPLATTLQASSLETTTGTLNAKVNPEGAATEYYFEYGKTTSYGTKVPTSAVSIGSGNSYVEVSQEIASLEIGTFYHYRVVAKGVNGTVYGGDEEFVGGGNLWTIGGVSIMEGLTVGEEYEGDFSWTAGNPAYSVYQCKVKLTIYAENEGGKQKAWIQGFDRSIENCFGTNGYSSCVNVGMTNDFLAGSELTLGKSETIDVVSPSGYVELKDVFQTPGSCPATGKAAKWNNGSLKIYPTVDGSGTITQVVLDGSTTQGIVNFTFGPLKRVSSFPYALGIKL